jgi:hypothetical protein
MTVIARAAKELTSRVRAIISGNCPARHDRPDYPPDLEGWAARVANEFAGWLIPAVG